MSDGGDFIGVVGDPDIHDARVVGVVEEGDRVSVILRRTIYKRGPATSATPLLQVRFEDVKDVEARSERGMLVYSLAELRGEPPWRRFVFTNGVEDSDARLEVWAQHLRCSDVPRFRCPCCGFPTLDDEPPGTYEICGVCGWEDDNVQYDDPDYPGGANKESLSEYRAEFVLRLKNNPSLRSQAEGWNAVLQSDPAD